MVKLDDNIMVKKKQLCSHIPFVQDQVFVFTSSTLEGRFRINFISYWIRGLDQLGFGLAPVHWSRCKLDTCPVLDMCQHRSGSNTLEHWSQTVPDQLWGERRHPFFWTLRTVELINHLSSSIKCDYMVGATNAMVMVMGHGLYFVHISYDNSHLLRICWVSDYILRSWGTTLVHFQGQRHCLILSLPACVVLYCKIDGRDNVDYWIEDLTSFIKRIETIHKGKETKREKDTAEPNARWKFWCVGLVGLMIHLIQKIYV